MADMPSRMSSLRTLLPDLEAALKSFTTSSSPFRVVRTVNPNASASTKHLKTLYVLDSSFNPPSRAHASLVESALKSSGLSRGKGDGQVGECRLLLLFSTSNADKAPSPASFAQRIALMTVFAEDLSRSFARSASNEGNVHSEDGEQLANVSIDIGLTTEPYYTDKSVAIATARPIVYPSNPAHVHLVGYDTLIRFCNPKYYQDFDPPLSALAPYFDAGHRLRVTARPYDPDDASSKEFGALEEQTMYVQNLRDGGMEKEGFKQEWGGKIEVVEGGKTVGISSTRVRKAAKERDWNEVGKLCTDGVAAWVKDQRLYGGDDSGKKLNS